MTVSWLVIASVSFVILLLIYIVCNLMMKVEKQEELLMQREEFLTVLNVQLKVSIEKLNELDAQGIYRSNDEIGSFYDEMMEATKNIDSIIGGISDQK